ncbi:OprD family outer membrane porin [Sulfuricurvum sp.]|uniref:OprD family outer membrane porin n=1 Tax=Sulfuricurvum sp. TaxID=2025608 RepID=UPI002629D31C|nr:OprD family outer membrane porin [Sulfuricurvum sp.]MDD4883938.1 OprD family outer membrane porin [Sulfuricurvum sp.]
MKLVKMSLAAAVLLGASAFAIDNVKVSGDAKLFYGTNDIGDNDLFSKGNDTAALTTGAGSYADTALRLGVTGDLTKGISFGVTGYAVSTLGLENNLVSQTWTGAHGVTAGTGSSFGNAAAGGAQVDDASWIGEAWIAATLGKTTVKLGRMELDTPFAFTEKWSIVPNTFEAAVVINQDIPDTTVVGAWVGKGNSGSHDLLSGTAFVGMDGGVVGTGGKFNTFVKDGAYAAAIVNNSFKPLTFQAWYYNVADVADAYWLQADINCQLVKGLTIGAQYADLSPKGWAEDVVGITEDSSAYAFKLGYTGVENLSVSAAFSQVDDQGGFKIQNVATPNGQSKLYTEAWWNYGYVGAPDAKTWTLTAEYAIKDMVKLGAYYTNVTDAQTFSDDTSALTLAKKYDMQEVALTATKSFGPLDATLAYISTDADDQNNGSQYDTIQAYLTLNF